MFAANTITVWIEALRAILNPNNTDPTLENISVSTEFPMHKIDYPGIWLNFTVNGDVQNVGIGHVEYEQTDQGFTPLHRWHFGGLVEITIATLSNLERALLLDKISTAIAIARADENFDGDLRKAVETNDLIGMSVVWESFHIGGFAETPGTPWETDEVVYEVTISLTIEGECVLNPLTGVVIPLSAIKMYDRREDEADTAPDPGLAWR